MPTSEDLRQLIKEVKDPGVRNALELSISGKVSSEVCCLSDSCRGRVIAHIYPDGTLREVDGTGEDGTPSGCTSSRDRLDGERGYSCACGNRSIESPAEKKSSWFNGRVLGPQPPSVEQLSEVHQLLSKYPANIVERDGGREVDGFLVRPFSGRLT